MKPLKDALCVAVPFAVGGLVLWVTVFLLGGLFAPKPNQKTVPASEVVTLYTNLPVDATVAHGEWTDTCNRNFEAGLKIGWKCGVLGGTTNDLMFLLRTFLENKPDAMRGWFQAKENSP